MSMFPCPECGRSCSTKAVSCPGCGLPFDQTLRNHTPLPTLQTNQTAPRSSVSSGPPNSTRQSSGFGKSTLKVVGGIALLLGGLSVSVLLNISKRGVLSDQTASRLAEDNPYLAKSDIVLLSNEITKRGLNTDQAKRFSFDTFGRGIALLNVNEQEEIARIREELFSWFSTEETIRWNSIYAKTESGQVPTEEEVEYLRQLQKKAVNSLPESERSRYQLLMGKALKAALNIH